MTRDDDRRRTDRRQPGRHQARPGLEGLEDRLLLYAASGGVWSQPIRVTYSLVADGTGVGGTPSMLFQTLNARFPTATWTAQFRQAAAIWEQVANINLVQVGDDGVPLGSGPDQQGDPNHGDIRIAGVAQPLSQLAVTFLPPPLNGGDIAGDIVLNTGETWQINNGAYDLLSIAIHEFGHALGLGESQIQAAVMYGYYNGSKQSLAPDDVAGIQSIYGARQPDPWYSYFHDSSMATAIDVTTLIDGNGQVAISRLDINSTVPAEWWKVTVPSSNVGSFTATMQSTNLSELSPAIIVYNSQGVGIASSVARGSFGATATVTIPNISAGQVYYIRAGAANDGPTSAGGYGLLLNFGNLPQAPIPAPYTTIPDQPSHGGGSDPNVVVRPGGKGSPGRIEVGSLSGPGDAMRSRSWWPGDPDGQGGTVQLPGGDAPTDPSLLVAPTPSPVTLDSAFQQLAGANGPGGVAGKRQPAAPPID